MATPTFVTDQTLIDNADATTNFGAFGNSMTVNSNTDFFRQGTASVSISSTGAAGRRGLAADITTGVDMTAANRFLYIWVWIATEKVLDTFANGGARIYVSSAASDTDYEEYTIGGSDVGPWIGKGWRLFVVDVGNAVADFSAGTLNKASVRRFGASIDIISSLGVSDVLAIDIMRYGSKVEVTGGSSSDPVTDQNIVDEDEAGGGDTQYGMLYQDPTGNKLLNGEMVLGDESGASNSVFLFKNANIFAQDQPTGINHTGITVAADTGTTELTFGSKIGSGADAVGADGVLVENIIDLFTKKVFFAASGAAINTFQMYDTSLDLDGPVSLGIDGTALGGSGDTFDCIDCVFLRCERIIKNIGATLGDILNNSIAFNKDYRASLDIEDQAVLLASEIAFLQSSGFIETSANASSITFDAKDFDFTKALVPYVNLTDADEIWDIINPNWVLETGKQKQVDFNATPTVTDNAGHANLPASLNFTGGRRAMVRASDGDLYFAYVNATNNDLEIFKSTDNGATWGTELDSAGAPTATSGSNRTIGLAIDSSDVIHLLYYDGGAVDIIKHTTFTTSSDTWSGTINTVRSGVTSEAVAFAIAVDSLDTVHVVFIDETNEEVFYNNSIDFSTNEVTVDTRTSGQARVDICIRPSDDVPLIAWGGDETSATNGQVSFFEGNARDATSFTENTVFPLVATSGIIDAVTMCCCDNDDVLIVYGNEVDDEWVVGRLVGGLALSIFEITLRVPFGATSGAVDQFTIAASNNRVVFVYADSADDELKFRESRNFGRFWDDVATSITTTTTSSAPCLRAVHGLHEGEIQRFDLFYQETTNGVSHAEIEFDGLAGDIRELFEITLTAKEPDGTLIFDAREKLVEASPTPALANEASTGAAGQSVTIEYLRRLLEPNNTTGGLTVADHNPTIVKSYKYIKLPFVTNLGTISAKQTLDAIHLVDDFNVETTPATAITLGDTTNDVQVENQTNSATLFKFTGGSGVDPTVGDTIGNDLDAAEGVFVELLEGDFVAGTMLLDTRNATAWPTAAHTLDDAASAGNWTSTFTATSLRNFKWLIDAATLTPQQLYDYFNAKFNEATLDTAADKLMDQIAIWGRAEHGLPIQGSALGSPNTFQTVRNVALTEGWAVYNIGGVGLSGFTQFVDDAGTVFTPAATVTITVTVLEAEDQTAIVGARVFIGLQSDNSEIVNDVTNGSGVVSASFTYTVDVDVFIRIREETEIYQRLAGTITSTGLTITVLLPDDDQYTPT